MFLSHHLKNIQIVAFQDGSTKILTWDLSNQAALQSYCKSRTDPVEQVVAAACVRMSVWMEKYKL